VVKKSTVPDKVGEVLREIGLTPDSSGWDCHGTYVLLHKALEKVAAHKGVVFDPPQILCANVTQKEAVVMVVGRMGERSEWSIGEAASYNNKNSYPFAMAEKRAKDRVILKLVGLHGDVYSEDEADAFKESRPEGMTASAQPAKKEPVKKEVEKEPPPEAVEEKTLVEADNLFTQIITKDPTVKTVINLWQVNLAEGLNIMKLKDSSQDRYLNLVEHRDQAFKHALNQVQDVKALSHQLTQDARTDLNAIKQISEEEFKAIMTLAKARKEELSKSEGE
tara:strand:+ start:3021 stop:3854 length:834 start_codon:yes stop_codon:yes gene_type:complete